MRIALDGNELAQHPLRVGLSMEATVDIHDTSGRMLAEGGRTTPVALMAPPDDVQARADAEVRRIILANSGRGAASAALARSGSRAVARSDASAAMTGLQNSREPVGTDDRTLLAERPARAASLAK